MIRVFRLLEYEYADLETMEKDIGRWYVGANATRIHPHMSIRSSVMMPTTEVPVDDVEQANVCKTGGCQMPMIGPPNYDNDEPIHVCHVGRCAVAMVVYGEPDEGDGLTKQQQDDLDELDDPRR